MTQPIGTSSVPWKIVEREERDGITCDIESASGELIASDVCCPPRVYAETDRTRTAFLIAAASSLYLLVERYRRYHDGVAQCESAHTIQECSCAVCANARVELAKARGEV